MIQYSIRATKSSASRRYPSQIEETEFRETGTLAAVPPPAQPQPVKAPPAEMTVGSTVKLPITVLRSYPFPFQK